MPIALSCDCGRSLRLKDELAGRKIRCPSCNASLTVPTPEANAEEEALDILLGDAPAEKKTPSRPAPVESGIQKEEPSRPVPTPVRVELPRPAPPPPKNPTISKRRPAKDEEDSGGRGFGIAINGNIIIGTLMVIGSVAWFLIRLGQGWLVFGSLFLFVFGILRIVRGFRGDA
jgi:hypothetical protein